MKRPSSVAELAELVRAAAEAGRTVKPIGSGHSFSGIGITDGLQLDMGGLTGLVALDCDSGLVTVQGGMALHRLNRLLDAAGLALTNLGDIDRQTISGAISTGTHGTGRTLGGLGTQVRALELVTAAGELVRVDPRHDPDLFGAARIGLGALGVIASVTLAAEPAFLLRAQEAPMRLDRVLAALDELVERNDHFEFYWFPHTDTTLTKRNNRVPAGTRRQPLSPLRSLLDDELLSNGGFWLTNQLGKTVPPLVPRINGVVSGLLSPREYVDASHRVFCSARRVRFVEMEYAVPRAAVAEALGGIRWVIERSDLRVSFPIEVRFAAADDIPLSTASGRETAYLAVHMVAGSPYERYFAEVEEIMAGLGGRPHWGKSHTRDATALRAVYPRFDEFLAVRERVDPAGVFRNDYLERVLGAYR